MTSNQPLTLLQQSAASGGNAQRPIQHGVKFCRNFFNCRIFSFQNILQNPEKPSKCLIAFPIQFWVEFLAPSSYNPFDFNLLFIYFSIFKNSDWNQNNYVRKLNEFSETLSIGDCVLCKRGLDGDNSYSKFLFHFRKKKCIS